MKKSNRIGRFGLVLALVFSSFSTVFSQAAAPQASGLISEFDVNGMKVLIKRRPGTPTVAAGLFIRGGVRTATADNAGIENFALNAAIEGGQAFPRQKLRKETSRAGTVIQAGANYDFSAVSLACTNANFDTSWQIFVDIALNPAFAAPDVERVREGILTGLRLESDTPEGSLESAFRKTVYAGHPYANGPEGTAANIAKFKVADLVSYHKNLMQASRLLLVVVGDVELETLKKRVTASFANVPRGDYKESSLPPIGFSKPTLDITAKPVKTDYVKGTFAAPSIRDSDYYAMRTAMTILQQRVFQEVRTNRNLSYAPDATLDERSANTASISVSSVNPNESVSVMLGEIQKLRQETLNEAAIGEMSSYFLTTHYLKLETNAAQVADLAQYELIGGGWRNSLEFLDRIRKVKPAEVQAVANKYMKNLRFVVVGNPADVSNSIFLQS